MLVVNNQSGEITMKKLALLSLPVFLFSAAADAASAANIGVSLTAPSGTHVYESGTYSIQVSNTGNRNASNVFLDIQLPETHTSPTVHIMGDLGTYSSTCSLSGTALTCSLGTINKGTSKTVSFDIAMPYSTAALIIDADATTSTPESNYANNSLSYTASPLTYDVPIAAPLAVTNSHCTGQNLTSYFECALYPSSISSFDSVLETDGSITIVGAPPGTVGTWTLTAPDALYIEYSDLSGPIGTLDARGVDGGCFEGPMTFPGSPWVAIYEICPQ